MQRFVALVSGVSFIAAVIAALVIGPDAPAQEPDLTTPNPAPDGAATRNRNN